MPVTPGFFGTSCVNIPKQSLTAMAIKHFLVSDLLGRIHVYQIPASPGMSLGFIKHI